MIGRRLAAWREAIVAEAVARSRYEALREHQLFGDPDRLRIAPTALVNDALFNTISGTVTVADHAFFGHGVAVLTGTHDTGQTRAARQVAVPDTGCDVVIEAGAWLSSRVTVIGPCRIGADAIVAAGAVVTGDVAPGARVGGVPARPLGHAAAAPAHLSGQDRMVLHALVVGLRPERVLDVGPVREGSAQVLGAALDAVGHGGLVCVDPAPELGEQAWAAVEHRGRLVAGPSPDALEEAERLAGGRFDFAFLHGEHSREGVVRDLEGALAVAVDDAHLVLHDALHATVREGIDDVLARPGGRLHDAGIVADQPTIDGDGRWWGGLRLLRRGGS